MRSSLAQLRAENARLRAELRRIHALLEDAGIDIQVPSDNASSFAEAWKRAAKGWRAQAQDLGTELSRIPLRDIDLGDELSQIPVRGAECE